MKFVSAIEDAFFNKQKMGVNCFPTIRRGGGRSEGKMSKDNYHCSTKGFLGDLIGDFFWVPFFSILDLRTQKSSCPFHSFQLFTAVEIILVSIFTLLKTNARTGELKTGHFGNIGCK